MTDEQSYFTGRRSAYTAMLRHCVIELGAADSETAKLVIEIEEARAALRTLCAELGCNDWPDDLALADVIEKYLGRAIMSNR